MSVIKLALIICDECGEVYGSGDNKQFTAKMQRKEYIEDGWNNVGRKDFCSECSSLITI